MSPEEFDKTRPSEEEWEAGLSPEFKDLTSKRSASNEKLDQEIGKSGRAANAALGGVSSGWIPSVTWMKLRLERTKAKDAFDLAWMLVNEGKEMPQAIRTRMIDLCGYEEITNTSDANDALRGQPGWDDFYTFMQLVNRYAAGFERYEKAMADEKKGAVKEAIREYVKAFIMEVGGGVPNKPQPYQRNAMSPDVATREPLDKMSKNDIDTDGDTDLPTHLREPTLDMEDCYGPVPPTAEEPYTTQDPNVRDWGVLPTPGIRRG